MKRIYILFFIVSSFNLLNLERIAFDDYSLNPGVCPKEAGQTHITECVDFDRWYIDKDTKVCKKFKYKGFGGNFNNFATEKQCRNHYTITPNDKVKGCSETPSKSGECGPTNGETKWTYISGTQTCTQFTYKGCGTSNNVYDSPEECAGYCKKEPDAVNIYDCSVKPEINNRNPPTGIIADTKYRRCVYSAVQTPNNGAGQPAPRPRGVFRSFPESTEEKKVPACQKNKPHIFPKSNDRWGKSDVVVRYYFNKDDNKCHRMESWPGDFDPKNNIFGSKDLCMSYCGGIDEDFETAEDICEMGVASVYNADNEESTGNLNIARYYYSHSDKTCKTFQYGGVGGNGNNFIHEKVCEKVCKEEL